LGNGTLLISQAHDHLYPFAPFLVAVILNHAPFGTRVRMIGSNEKATRYSGVADLSDAGWRLYRVQRIPLGCGIVMMARFNSGARRLCGVLSAGHHSCRGLAG
jgi:ABC-type uncharacterized transport system permease subunit